jgi:hypothetical protein
MFFRSLLWERTVLSLLEKVEHLPPNVQAEIAARAGEFIKVAQTASDAASLSKFAAAAVAERQQVLAQGAKSKLDQRWAAPAIAEAWCIARIGLSNGSLDKHSALGVLKAIEGLTVRHPR